MGCSDNGCATCKSDQMLYKGNLESPSELGGSREIYGAHDLHETVQVKECPVCHARCFADMDTCYGCLHRFGSEHDAASDPSITSSGMPKLSTPEVEADLGLTSRPESDTADHMGLAMSQYQNAESPCSSGNQDAKNLCSSGDQDKASIFSSNDRDVKSTYSSNDRDTESASNPNDREVGSFSELNVQNIKTPIEPNREEDIRRKIDIPFYRDRGTPQQNVGGFSISEIPDGYRMVVSFEQI